MKEESLPSTLSKLSRSLKRRLYRILIEMAALPQTLDMLLYKCYRVFFQTMKSATISPQHARRTFDMSLNSTLIQGARFAKDAA